MEYTGITTGMLGNNCYIVDSDGEAMVVDVPMQSVKVIVDYLERNNLELTTIFLTHGHYDHVAEAGLLAEKTGGKLFIHQSEADTLTDVEHHKSMFEWAGDEYFINFKAREADGFLQDGDEIEIGNDRFVVLHTPGHTPGGLSLVNHEAKLVFVGDALFDGSIGRTDLPGGNLKQLIAGIKEKLMTLPNDYLVLTGHGDKTTIGNEKINNGYLAYEAE